MRLQPIRVFCMHQTSEIYDPDVYCNLDWIPLSFLKDFVRTLQNEGYKFISLTEAYRHVQSDYIRTHKYAVLTADDGLLCQLDLIPWLEQQHIPMTMFVNVKNLDGKTCGHPMINYFKIENEQQERLHASKLYCTKEQLFAITSPILSIGMHGVTHDRVTSMSQDEFLTQLKECQETLSSHPNYIPYFAFPHGAHNIDTDECLWRENVVPVLAGGGVNYNDAHYVYREIFEYLYKCHNLHS